MHEETSHIRKERISALLDEPGSDAAATRHLEACDACGREHERMRRMRMALSAMDELDPPAGEWGRIEAALRAGESDETEGAGTGEADGRSGLFRDERPGGTGGTRPAGAGSPPWGARARSLLPDGAAGLRAAAAVLLFLGGTWLGVTLRDGGPPSAAAGSGDRATEMTTSEGPAIASQGSGEERTVRGEMYPRAEDPEGAGDARQWLAGLQSLRARGPAPEEVASDPDRAAEHLARLDALIQASSAYIQDVPSDPEVNDFLFEVVEERNSLNQVLRFASLEYR